MIWRSQRHLSKAPERWLQMGVPGIERQISKRDLRGWEPECLASAPLRVCRVQAVHVVWCGRAVFPGGLSGTAL